MIHNSEACPVILEIDWNKRVPERYLGGGGEK